MVSRLNAELIKPQQHPALAAFYDYVREKLPAPPNPEDIKVVNQRLRDGRIHLFYQASDGNLFQAEIDARATHDQVIFLWERLAAGGEKPVPVQPVEFRNVGGVCRTVTTLGGRQEVSKACPKTPISIPPLPPGVEHRGKARETWIVNNYLYIEAINFFRRRCRGFYSPLSRYAASPMREVITNFRPWMTLSGGNELSLVQRLNAGTPALVTGAAGYIGAQILADKVFEWDPKYHDKERFALSAGSAQLASHAASFTRKTASSPSKLGNKLLTVALIDATLGRLWEEGSTERNMLRMGSFFLPDISRTVLGNRALGIAETRGAKFVARWGGRAMTAGFLVDAGAMAMRHLRGGGSARENAIYRRANELEDQRRGAWTWAAHGVVSFVTPSLAERWVDRRYVSEATVEMNAQAAATAEHASGFLRRSLLLGSADAALDPNFYREIDWKPLLGKNKLENIRTSDGRSLPLRGIAEQLSDPRIYRREVESGDSKRLVAYLQRQFSGYRLSAQDVEQCLALIGLNGIQENLAQLRGIAGPEERPLADCFDKRGALISGKEEDLLRYLFPEIHSPEQILGLRRVALTKHILELRELHPSGDSAELAAYSRVAREIGLMDENNEWAEKEETQLARGAGEAPPFSETPAQPSAAEMMVRWRQANPQPIVRSAAG